MLFLSVTFKSIVASTQCSTFGDIHLSVVKEDAATQIGRHLETHDQLLIRRSVRVSIVSTYAL